MNKTPFGNLKFFIKNQESGELEVKYVCEDCGKTMETPFHWQIRLSLKSNIKRSVYYYWCKKCWEKESEK